ncbi:MAG: thymidine phosphorylase [Alphaproteobacteria bacterium]|nr:thymidine phosphorylase [Alphaproteobacteria bacterium]
MLKLKHLKIDTGKANAAYINRECADLQMTFVDNWAERVEIHGGIESLFADLYLVDDASIVAPNEIGLSTSTFKQLNLPEGSDLAISPASPPASVESIRRKIKGGILSSKEYSAIIADISAYRYTPTELAAFLVSNASFNSPQEVLSLTQALCEHRTPMDWGIDLVVDEHCIGGVPANRFAMIVTPIVIAHGLTMPSTITRSVTSCSGTADAMEVFANVTPSTQKMNEMVSKIGGCMVLDGGRLSLSNVNTLMGLEKIIGISTPHQIVSSILASKISMGITHLLIDIPVGKTAKIRTMSEAMSLRKLFEYVGDMMNITVDAIITDGSEPVGNGIGPVLEARDVMKVLRNQPDAPVDLLEKSLYIAGRIIEFDPNMRGGQGYNTAKEILESGKAFEAMQKLVNEQGALPMPMLGQLTRDVTAQSSGVISEIDCSFISKIAMTAGAPQDKGAGIDLMKKVGDYVNQGEILYRIYATKPTSFAFANGLAEGSSGYTIINQGISTI